MTAANNLPHAMLLATSSDALTREQFCGALTQFLEVKARPVLRGIYQREVRPALVADLGREPTRREIATAMRARTENKLWYSARTHSQKRSYTASANVVTEQLPQLLREARRLTADAAQGPRRGSLQLDPELTIPRYVSALDFHWMPGGYQTEREANDVLAGALFDRQMTINRAGTQGALNDDPGVSIADWLKKQFPDFKPRRILEMGCTVGHNTLPFKLAFPEAEVHGIDVAAPCLRYAHARAESLGVAVHFSQQNAERTSFEDASFNLVYSRILLHETSHQAVPRIIAETRRLLRPGGIMFHSDAPQFDELDAYSASLRDWDIHFNNEPFMDRYYDLPLEQLFAAAGFRPSDMFRAFAPSLFVARQGIDPKINRSAGRYFLAGASANS